MVVILGAGLAGISVADHLKKYDIPFEIFEAKGHGGGHIYSEVVNGFTWDEGPHVSFTKHEYVKKYFEQNCSNEYLEFPTKPTNYFKQSWIPHPAQSNLYAIPEPLRSECIQDVQEIRSKHPEFSPQNYQEWIDYAFGKTFAKIFPNSYTVKYWTTEPENLTTDWIGKRIYFPEITDMLESANGPLEKKTHYIDKVRYPKTGGYYSYIKSIEKQLPIQYHKKLINVSFEKKLLSFEDGSEVMYDQMISTLPLPLLINNSDAPKHIKEAVNVLNCSKVLIINVVVNHPSPIDNHWIYVYDDDMYSTRINFTELLSPNNGVGGKTGIQVEVYFSNYRKRDKEINEIAEIVLDELVSMKLARSKDDIEAYHTQWLDWANVIFDTKREKAQNLVLAWLETQGLIREDDDLEPMTEWEKKENTQLGNVILAGRFAQWKYFWTDDCVMRGLYIANSLKNLKSINE